MSRIRRIANLISGDETVDGLTADTARDLDRSICQQIAQALNIDAEDSAPVICLAAWLARASYHLPVELFTINYDLLLENALETMRVPYYPENVKLRDTGIQFTANGGFCCDRLLFRRGIDLRTNKQQAIRASLFGNHLGHFDFRYLGGQI
ncbi:MAG: hypothetical protein OXC63_09240 [Aestuariivita sp.]|nr:hypothetical protein [Aestuariivita sp.]